MNTKALKVFFVYTIVLSVFVFLHVLSIYYFKSKEVYFNIIQLYTLVEFVIFSIFFRNVIQNAFAKNIILFSTIPFSIFCIYNYFQSQENFNVYPLLVEFIFFMIVIIYFLYEKMKTEVLRPLYQSIVFWISVGLFIYFSGNFFYLVFIQSTNDKSVINQLKIIYSAIAISKDILLSLAFFAHETSNNDTNDLYIPEELHLDSFNPKSTLN